MFNWFQRLLPRTGDFFGMFEAHAETLVAAADAMTKLVDGGKPNQEQIAQIEQREHDPCAEPSSPRLTAERSRR